MGNKNITLTFDNIQKSTKFNVTCNVITEKKETHSEVTLHAMAEHVETQIQLHHPINQKLARPSNTRIIKHLASQFISPSCPGIIAP